VGYLLPKARLKDSDAPSRGSSFIAPLRRVSDGVVVFEDVKKDADFERLDLSKNPQFSAKKFFMPAYATLFEYDVQDQRVTDRASCPRSISFRPAPLRLNSVRIQDALFIGRQFVDDHYKAARDHVFLVGYYCNTPPSTFCFCESMKLMNYYDLMLASFRNRKISSTSTSAARKGSC